MTAGYMEFKHNLNTTELLIYFQCQNDGEINKMDEDPVYERLNNTYISVWFDESHEYDKILVMIWKIEPEVRPVGGFYVPVDKFNLLVPYIALVSTIILTISTSVAYIKYRKKQ